MKKNYFFCGSPENFSNYWSANRELLDIFPPEQIRDFLASRDHGLPHAKKVFLTSVALINRFPSRIPIDSTVVEIACVFHDAGRSNPEEETKKNHEVLGAKLASRFVKRFGLAPDRRSLVVKAVRRHDYFNPKLSLARNRPRSPEEDIVRAADKMSVEDPAAEINRYWSYAKRIGYSYFQPGTPLLYRLNWTFANQKDKESDEVCFFLAMLSLKPEDFFYPPIQEAYREWSKKKEAAIGRIVEICQEEMSSVAANLLQDLIQYLKDIGFLVI